MSDTNLLHVSCTNICFVFSIFFVALYFTVGPCSSAVSIFHFWSGVVPCQYSTFGLATLHHEVRNMTANQSSLVRNK